MTTTLSNGTDTVTPDAVNGYQTNREARTIAHDILGRGDPDITLRPASTRRGSLELLFADEAPAAAAEVAHAGAHVWTLANTDLGTIGMLYVVAEGGITRALDDTRACWLVSIPFREVLP
ncbi:hypothetical protein [Agromyces sp. Root81]|uniref:hypothetical protein n=1 Tax=Agromyces sp. Root81 TaxID=1736601 RepID=UPI0006F37EED|nr:hypothetical protein [Agromyces sp. Root81]